MLSRSGGLVVCWFLCRFAISAAALTPYGFVLGHAWVLLEIEVLHAAECKPAPDKGQGQYAKNRRSGKASLGLGYHWANSLRSPPYGNGKDRASRTVLVLAGITGAEQTVRWNGAGFFAGTGKVTVSR